MGISDLNSKSIPSVGSIPAGNQSVITASVVITAGDSRTFKIINTPVGSQLSLWNYSWNVFIDTDDPTYDYYGGSALTLAQRTKLFVSDNENWAQSSDVSNIRAHRIKVVNTDSVDHTLFLKYKAYTYAGIA